MRSRLAHAALVPTVLGLVVLPLSLARARDVVVPAGTLLQCTLNEPNFSSATAEVGDPVLCHLRGLTEFGQQAFPRGSYLVGHLESAKDPGHFWGKGNLKLQFDRIGLPSGDLPLEAKVIATRGYKVDKAGKIDGKGHAKRDIIEWMLPPLWPWKIIMLPARGPRPQLKGETVLSLRLMDDVQVPQLAQTFGPNWHFFGRPQNESFRDAQASSAWPQLAVREVGSAGNTNGDGDRDRDRDRDNVQTQQTVPQASYATYISRDVTPPSPASIVSLPGMPVFVLNTGTILSVSGYGYQDSRITYTLIGGGSGVISAGEVDWTTTTRINAQRGVRITLRGGRNIPEVSEF
jgi:hypothetical protein